MAGDRRRRSSLWRWSCNRCCSAYAAVLHVAQWHVSPHKPTPTLPHNPPPHTHHPRRQLSQINDQLAEIVAQRTEPSPSAVHTLSRHRDILNEYSREFAKTRTNIRHSRDRQELLSSVQRDINTYRTAGTRREDLYLKEHEHIQSSDRLADETIGMAMSAREALRGQRQTMRGVGSRVTAAFQRFPAVNSLMQKINLRKRRDALILAVVFSLCIIFTIWYTMH